MTRTITLLIISLFFWSTSLLGQRNDSLKTVLLTTTINDATPSITLQWVTRSDAVSYSIFRKEPEDLSWGNVKAFFDGSGSSWEDTDVEIGKLYEYRVARVASGVQGNGYIHSGIEVEREFQRGSIIAAIDTSVISSDNPKLMRYFRDLTGEGWMVYPLEVDRELEVPSVKSMIQNIYSNAPITPRALVLIGRVPVPYSGYIFPDGHGPGSGNHNGAWAADPYYGDLDGMWTDNIVDNETASDPRNRNIPGDGKFDQGAIPSDLELEVGRIDFSNLPAFGMTELELLEQYFDKNHAYRTMEFVPEYRALIENNFANFGEGFGQNGQKNFSALVGPDKVEYIDYNNLFNESYLWSYGCGAGNFQGASGIGNTNSLAQNDVNAVFTMHFGSYFGDWDSPTNNYLKAALASGTVLTNAWAGRPNWSFFPMGMGETIGYCARLSQNNSGGLYDPGFANRGVHTALLGDPTLTMNLVPPVKELRTEETDDGIKISWKGNNRNEDLYDVYRQNADGSYSSLTQGLISDSSYVINCPIKGETYIVAVSAVNLINTPTGSYFNHSRVILDTIVPEDEYTPEALFEASVLDNQGNVAFVNQSERTEGNLWTFGDGTTSMDENPSHQYLENGDYSVSLITTNECGSDTFTVEVTIDIMTSVYDQIHSQELKVFPNPATNEVVIEGFKGNGNCRLYDMGGKSVLNKNLIDNRLDISHLNKGMYYGIITQDGQIFRVKFAVM